MIGSGKETAVKHESSTGSLSQLNSHEYMFVEDTTCCAEETKQNQEENKAVDMVRILQGGEGGWRWQCSNNTC